MKIIAITVVLSGFILTSVGFSAVVTLKQDANHSYDFGGNTKISHGGGLDACGGHWNHKKGTYHYHRKKC